MSDHWSQDLEGQSLLLDNVWTVDIGRDVMTLPSTTTDELTFAIFVVGQGTTF